MSSPISWEARHYAAWNSPVGVERPIVSLIEAADEYVRSQVTLAREERDEEDWYDYVLGAGIGEVISGIRVLLNGDIGRLDGGACDAHLVRLAEMANFDLDLMEMAR